MGRMTSRSVWWKRLQLPWQRWRVVGQVSAGDEIPTDIPVRGAVVVATNGLTKWLAFDCPCGIGHRVMLNLDAARRPTWRLVSDNPLTVTPSIDDVAKGRRCHFFVHAGRIQWAVGTKRARK